MAKPNTKGEQHSTSMTLGDHFEELRKRLAYALVGLVICVIIGFCFGSRIIAFVEIPYVSVMGTDVPLQSLAPSDGFLSFMNISLIAGMIMSSPWVFYHLWMFIAAGLYPHERRYVYFAIPFSTLLFVTGALFFLFIVASLSLGFLVKFNQKMLGVKSNFTFQNYISFVTTLMVVFGIAFQTPVVIFCLNKTGIVSLDALRRSRKFVLLGIFIIAAMATPPDIISQITLAVPLYLLFELGILLSRFAS
jgi:sec-independent protein translocase protein TatC